MDEDKQDSSGISLNLPIILLLLAAAGNLFWTQTPLFSSRPADKVSSVADYIPEQKLQARLWQDPFAVLETQGGDTNLPIRDLSWLVEKHRSETNTVTIMPVFVSGSPYAEWREWRIRSRFAILSGLARCDYVPCDRDHVGWLRVTSTNSEHGLTNIAAWDIPFEWYQKTITNNVGLHNDALVLWIKEELVGDNPLENLGKLFAGLGLAEHTNINLRIIGPESSSSLRAMWENETQHKDAFGRGTNANICVLSNAHIYSCSATFADWRLFRHNPTNTVTNRLELLTELKSQYNITFQNFTCTDDQMAKVLVEELALRGLDWTRPHYHVALVSEWDTTYGRSLPESFTNAVAQYQLTKGSIADTTTGIEQFTYLQGLDGETAQDPRVQEAWEKQTTTSSHGEQAKQEKMNLLDLQKPEGGSQLDYIPRLAMILHDKESRWKQNKQRLDAIGILGSDVYDKLLLMQSLREHFPEAIFFTTDLDARLFDVKQLRWTRNLVVSSSFGLNLGDDLQWRVAPFRDGYQTAKYLACLRALNLITNFSETELQARCFEIGKYGPFDLSSTNNAVVSTQDRGECDLYPPSHFRAVPVSWLGLLAPVGRLGIISTWGLAFVLAVFPTTRKGIRAFFHNELIGSVIVIGGLLALFSVLAGNRFVAAMAIVVSTGTAGYQAWPKSNLLRKPTAVAVRNLFATIAVLAVVGAFAVVISFSDASPMGQPFSVMQGVSLWPTEIIRFLTLIICVALLIKAQFDLHEETDKTAKEFGLDECEPARADNAPRLGDPSTHKRWSKASIANWSADKLKVKEDNKDKIDAPAFWREYCHRGHQAFRYMRALRTAAIAFAFAASFFLLFENPFVPYRGGRTLILDRVLMGCCAFGLLFLTFYVIDASHLCAKSIEILNEHETKWPEPVTRIGHGQTEPPGRAEWLDIKFIGRRTSAVGKMIYYPFVIIFLLIAARNSMFAAWRWSLSLYIIFALNIAYACVAAIRLRRRAEEARSAALDSLRRKEFVLLAKNANDKQLEHLRLCIKEVKTNKIGAFAPLFQQPIFKAVLLPFGGAGALSGLQYLLGQ